MGYVGAMAYRPVTDFDRAVSAYIRATAALKKLTKAKLAERCGISIDTFKRYWSGDRSITLGDFNTIIGALQVDPEQAIKEIRRIFEAGEYAN